EDKLRRILPAKCHPEHIDIELYLRRICFFGDDLHSRSPAQILKFPCMVMVVERYPLVLQSRANLVEKSARSLVPFHTLSIRHAAAHHISDAHRLAVRDVIRKLFFIGVLSVTKMRARDFEPVYCEQSPRKLLAICGKHVPCLDCWESRGPNILQHPRNIGLVPLSKDD